MVIIEVLMNSQVYRRANLMILEINVPHQRQILCHNNEPIVVYEVTADILHRVEEQKGGRKITKT